MGVEPAERQVARKDVDYVGELRKKLEYAYELATRSTEKQSGRGKVKYDRRVRGAIVTVGDRVLVRKVGIKGRCKIANRWEEEVYVVVDQPNEDVPVFVVKREGKGRATRTLHRNLLLPVNFLPLPEKLDKIVKSETRAEGNHQEQEQEGLLSNDTEKEYDADAETDESVESEEPAMIWVSNPVFQLNPGAEEFVPESPAEEQDVPGEHEPVHNEVEEVLFVPRRSTRQTRPPAWFTSGDFVT